MKTMLNQKWITFLAFVATFILPVVAFAADEEPVVETVASMDGIVRWTLLCMFGLIAFIAILGVLIGVGFGFVGLQLADDGSEEEG